MISLENKPKTYKNRVNWYVSIWSSVPRPIELYSTKYGAMVRAKHYEKLYPGLIISVGWFDINANPEQAISSTANFVDYRNN